MRKTTFLFIYLLCFFGFIAAVAQEPVRLSGVVVEAAANDPIPNATIKNISSGRSLLADSLGFFSLPANAGDTILFEAMLYKPGAYIVPEQVDGHHFAVIEVLQKDAVVLEEVSVRPFPTQMQFERTLLELDPADVIEKTIRLDEELEEVTADPTNMQQYIRTFNENYYDWQVTYLIPETAPANNFLNPERWARFIRDWQEGRFSEEGVEKLMGFPEPEEERE